MAKNLCRLSFNTSSSKIGTFLPAFCGEVFDVGVASCIFRFGLGQFTPNNRYLFDRRLRMNHSWITESPRGLLNQTSSRSTKSDLEPCSSISISALSVLCKYIARKNNYNHLIGSESINRTRQTCLLSQKRKRRTTENDRRYGEGRQQKFFVFHNIPNCNHNLTTVVALKANSK